MSAKNEMHSLGIKLGTIFGVSLVTLAILSMGLGIGDPVILLLASLYKGYAATFVGALMGFIWGFIHGYVVGVLTFLLRKHAKI